MLVMLQNIPKKYNWFSSQNSNTWNAVAKHISRQPHQPMVLQDMNITLYIAYVNTLNVSDLVLSMLTQCYVNSVNFSQSVQALAFVNLHVSVLIKLFIETY